MPLALSIALVGCSDPSATTWTATPPGIGSVEDSAAPLAPLTLPDSAAPPPTFQNPVAEGTPDPFVFHHDGFVYLVWSDGEQISLRRAPQLIDLGDPARTDERVIWTPPPETPHSVDLWAPELHQVQGQWTLYYSATDSSFLGISANQRVWALQPSDDDLLNATWTHQGQVAVPSADVYAIHPTVLHQGDADYLLWAGRRNRLDQQNRIFIAELTSPLTLAATRSELLAPAFEWEQDIANDLEAPTVVEHEGRRVLLYASSSCLSDLRALGMAHSATTDDPTDPSAWTRQSTPVFEANAAENVLAPAQPSVVTSADGTEHWLVYHAVSEPRLGCGDQRALHLGPIRWRPDGLPDLGVARGASTPIDVPAGDVP